MRAELGLRRLLGHLERHDELWVFRGRLDASGARVPARTELGVGRSSRGRQRIGSALDAGPLAATPPGEVLLSSGCASSNRMGRIVKTGARVDAYR